MIKSRTVKGGTKGKPLDTEYFLQVKTQDGRLLYNDWFKLDDLVELPECTVGRECLLDRIRKRPHLFPTLKDCVFEPAKTGSNLKLRKLLKQRYKDKASKKARPYFEECPFYELDKLWKPGSMCNDYRIMGSIEL